MSVEVKLSGRGLQDLNRKLKKLDAKKLKRQLNAELRKAAKPLIPKAQAAARSELPKRGGLNDVVAGQSMRVSVTSKGVRIVGKGQGVSATNRGRLRHPVYGNRKNWVTQSVTPGWFDDTMRKHAPEVRPDLVKVIDRFAKEVADA